MFTWYDSVYPQILCPILPWWPCAHEKGSCVQSHPWSKYTSKNLGYFAYFCKSEPALSFTIFILQFLFTFLFKTSKIWHFCHIISSIFSSERARVRNRAFPITFSYLLKTIQKYIKRLPVRGSYESSKRISFNLGGKDLTKNSYPLHSGDFSHSANCKNSLVI